MGTGQMGKFEVIFQGKRTGLTNKLICEKR